MASTGQIRALNMLTPEVPIKSTPWVDDVRYELEGLSASGAPPAKLLRVVLRVSIEDPTAAEQEVVKGVMTSAG